MGTSTTNIGLYKPTIGETGWGALVNTSIDDLDTLAGATVILQVASAKFPNAQVLGDLGNGILKNTATTGVLTLAATGVDYYGPGGIDIPVGDGGTGTSAIPNNGDVLIGSGGSYTPAQLTAGVGITITPGAGSIQIDATGASAAGGADTQIQYNSGGSLAGDAGIVRTGAGSLSLTNLTLTNDLPLTEGGTGASTAAGARTNLGLDDMALQNSGAVAITGGSITGVQIAIADGGTGASDAATARTNLGLGTMAVQNAASVAITGGSITGITDLAVADGGLGTSTVPNAGQIPIGNGGGSYTPASITAGTGISITEGASSITIDATSAGHVIQEEGVPVPNRTNLNFVGGNVTVTDGGAGPDSTIVTISAGGSQHVIADEGTPLTARSILNFVGAGVTATDGGAGPDSSIVTIPGGEFNTASNQGGGEGTIYIQKTGVDLELKTLRQGANIVITNNATEIQIAAAAGGSQHIIQDEGVPLTARSRLNFVGDAVTVTDGGAGPDSTIVTVTGTGRSFTYALMGA